MTSASSLTCYLLPNSFFLDCCHKRVVEGHNPAMILNSFHKNLLEKILLNRFIYKLLEILMTVDLLGSYTQTKEPHNFIIFFKQVVFDALITWPNKKEFCKMCISSALYYASGQRIEYLREKVNIPANSKSRLHSFGCGENTLLFIINCISIRK